MFGCLGRTGRAGKEGKAITFFTKADAGHLKTYASLSFLLSHLPTDLYSHNSHSIVNVMRQSGCKVPDWMLALPNPSQDSKKALKMRPIGRKDISKTNGAGAADDVRDGKGMKGKRERVMGGKGGVFKRREGEEEGERRRKEGEEEKERIAELDKGLTRAREREGGLEAEIGRLRSVSDRNSSGRKSVAVK